MWTAIPLLLLAAQMSGGATKAYENSLVLAPMYVEYDTVSAAQFAEQVAALKSRIGEAPHVLLGFATFLNLGFPATDLNRPLTPQQMAPTLETIDRIVDRARANDIVVHIAILSGFFHGMNDLRRSAIRQDVRNAQWFADGDIAEPRAWITPSRYAKPLRSRMEEGIRMVGARLAARMALDPQTLLTVSGDGEVELSYERQPMIADYSPFVVEEFREWIRRTRYEGDLSPATDDNNDGRTFNRDFHESFATWRLRYFDSSGPIPLNAYRALNEKLPSSGRYFVEGGFDAPRSAKAGDRFWQAWMEFRKQVVANYVKDFAGWITASVPASRYYTHQMPADFLFEKKDSVRLQTSASPAGSAVIAPIGSTGVTAFNAFDGKKTKKTATPALFRMLSRGGANWGVFEYNPSTPVGAAKAPITSLEYYLGELRALYSFKPHVIVPFAYTKAADLKAYSLENSVFEQALKRFVAEVVR